MGSEEQLKIGYGGSLKFYNPLKEKKVSFFKKIRSWFWSYQNKNIDYTTRSPYYFFKAVKLLKQQGAVNAEILKLNFWGLIDEENKRLAENLNIEDLVTFNGYLTKDRSNEKISSSDILFLPLESGKNNIRPLFIPGKLFEYLKFGKPVLVLAQKDSEAARILKESGLGIITDPEDIDAIASTLLYLIKNKKNLKEIYKPNKTFIDQYKYENLTRKLADVLSKVSGE